MNQTPAEDRPTVFVVDDEQQICALLERILSREGYDVCAFSDSHEALRQIENRRPDLVVTDLMMPGLGGLELIARTRTCSPTTAAVVITGYASIGNVVEALRSGVDDFVTKPFSVSEIRGVVAAVLEKRMQPASPDAPTPDAPTPDSRLPYPTESETRAPTPSGIGYADAALSRRITEMSVRERLHALLAEEVGTADLLSRSADLLRGALDVGHAVILVPATRELGFRVLAATAPPAALARTRDASLDMTLDGLLDALAAVSVAPTALPRSAIEPLLPLLDEGPVAAASLTPRRSATEGAVLVVSRRADAPPLDGSGLRRLGVVAAALGDVFRARREVERAETAYVECLGAVAAATEARIPCFAHHSERVRELSVRLGRHVGLAAPDIELLGDASRLLDVGRVSVPDAVLSKRSALSDADWRAVRRHVAVADDLVQPVGRLRHAKPIIRHHHENWDGSGYPDGLRGEEIPYLAALVRITDAYVALTATRTWRPALDDDGALRKIRELAGRHFHPELVTAFAEIERGDGIFGDAAE